MRIVVGYPPGGPTDIFARLMGQWLSDHMGQQFIIENRPGAGSTIGVQAVVNAAADGYTLITLSTSAVISAQYYKNLNFNLTRDIAPVCGIALEPLVMVVNPAVAAKTVPEFIAEAKAKPGKFVMASVGNGTTPHMAGQLFMMMAGVEMLHVPYQGAAPALTDLLGGRADVMFEAMPTLVGHIREGKLRALGGRLREALVGVSRHPDAWASSCPATRRTSGSASARRGRRRATSSSGSTGRSMRASTIRRCAPR